jgi:hypothetical protein
VTLTKFTSLSLEKKIVEPFLSLKTLQKQQKLPQTSTSYLDKNTFTLLAKYKHAHIVKVFSPLNLHCHLKTLQEKGCSHCNAFHYNTHKWNKVLNSFSMETSQTIKWSPPKLLRIHLLFTRSSLSLVSMSFPKPQCCHVCKQARMTIRKNMGWNS